MNQLNATKLRIILISSLIAIIAISVVIFTYANKQLKSVAVEVSHATVDAAASENNLSSLSLLEKLLDKQRDVVNRTTGIVADSQSYQYQNQIIDDLEGYARQAKISITNLDFGSTTATGAAAATPPAAGGAVAPTAGAAAPSGVKATSVSITLVNPVDYKSLLTFVNLIEQNLTKMQISKLSLSADASAPGKVTSDALTIEVYVK